jgi:hypothetical protein
VVDNQGQNFYKKYVRQFEVFFLNWFARFCGWLGRPTRACRPGRGGLEGAAGFEANADWQGLRWGSGFHTTAG